MKTIKFVLYENGESSDSVEVKTDTQLSELIKSLENFQHIVNSKITKKIEEGEVLDDYIEDDFNSSDTEEEPIQHINPKKRKL